MAIAYVSGQLTRDPFFRDGEKTPFCGLNLKETYTDNKGEERLGGYHDVVAFGEQAQELAALEQGDYLEVQATIRYRPDKRFVSTQDSEKNPFAVQFVVRQILKSEAAGETGDEPDPFEGV